MSKVYIIDVARADGMRGALIAALARSEGFEAHCVGPRDLVPTDDYVGVLGHHPDIETA